MAIPFGAGDSTPDFGLAFQVQLGTEFRVTLMNYHHQRKLFTLFRGYFFPAIEVVACGELGGLASDENTKVP